MTTDADGTPTPQKVADLATRQINLDRLALIGVFGSPSSFGALVRLPNSKVTRVKAGDKIAAGTVVAIGEDRIVISRMGSELMLKLPHL